VTTKPMRVLAPITATALVGSATNVAVNLATEWKTNWWAWLGVVTLTVISIPISLWLDQRPTRTDSALGAHAALVDTNVYTPIKNRGTASAPTGSAQRYYYGTVGLRAAAPDSPALSTAKPLLHHYHRIRRRPLVTTAIVALLAVSAIVTFRLAGPAAEHPLATGVEPAMGLIHDDCMQVTAHNVRVFTDPQSDQTWTSWTTGTEFWADPNTSALHRYRTTLSNGSQGWITANPHWVTAASDCA
jgi:hypothetical protein